MSKMTMIVAIAAAGVMAGCASIGEPSTRDVFTLIGAGVGAAVGAPHIGAAAGGALAGGLVGWVIGGGLDDVHISDRLRCRDTMRDGKKDSWKGHDGVKYDLTPDIPAVIGGIEHRTYTVTAQSVNKTMTTRVVVAKQADGTFKQVV